MFGEGTKEYMEVHLQKAAMVLGIPPSALRQRIKEGELQARQEGKVWYVELPDKEGEIVPLKSHMAPIDEKLPTPEEPPVSEPLIETLRKQVEINASMLKIKDRQIQELHMLLQQSILQNRRNSWWQFGR